MASCSSPLSTSSTATTAAAAAYLRAATEEDAHSLAPRLREVDVRELWVTSGIAPLEALLAGVTLSVPHAWTLVDAQSGKPIVMGGVRPAQEEGHEGMGIIWMLASLDITQHALTAQREARSMLFRIFKEGEYRVVTNVVHADNHKAVQWLKRLGFTFIMQDISLGTDNEKLHIFAMCNPLQKKKEVAISCALLR